MPEPRTFRSRTRPAPQPDEEEIDGSNADEVEATPAPSRTRDAKPADDDEDVPVIRGGWTEGQQIIDSTSSYAQALKLDEKSQVIKFLDDAPYASYRRHWVERPNAQGSTSNRAYVCLQTVGKECPLCDIGDRAQAVSSFNVALVGDDGQLVLKTWDVGVKIFNVLQAYNNDRKIGPLSKGFYLVNKTGKRQQVQYNCSPVPASSLLADFGVEPPTAEELRKVGRYDSSILTLPKLKELEEIADELADD